MNSWLQNILIGVTLSVLLAGAGLAGLFIEPDTLLLQGASLLCGLCLVAAPAVLMHYLRQIL